jgi:hypothetical protein
MTSTLPNFSACPTNSSGSCGFNFAAMTGPVAAPGVAVDPASPTEGLMPEFAALLPQASATPSAVLVSVPAVARVPGETIVSQPTTRGQLENATLPAAAPVVPGETISAIASSRAQSSARGPVRPHGISREEFEHAAAFVAALMQSLTPSSPVAIETAGTDVAVPSAVESPRVAMPPKSLPGADEVVTKPAAFVPVGTPDRLPAGKTPVSPENPTDLVLPNGRAFPTILPDQVKPGFTFKHAASAESSGVMPIEAPAPQNLPEATPSMALTPPPAELAATVELPETLVGDHSVQSAPPADEPWSGATLEESGFTVARDGAIEVSYIYEAPAPAESVSSVPLAATEEPVMQVSAELDVPGQPVVRVETVVPAPTRESSVFAEAVRPENFAGQPSVKKSVEKTRPAAVERNFVAAGDKQVTRVLPEDGITVAKPDSTMRTVSIEEIQSPRSSDALSVFPARVDFQVIQSPAERITVAPAEPAVQNFAERAVATVTGLADAQFSASMQKAGSVQLRLKFGGEDLSVRVELRDGAVHTDFRTDSPALREAISREWQAVAAASPGNLQRFLDPVFSPSSPATSTDAGTQHHASHRQPQQQPSHDQSSFRQDAWHSQSPFSRRSNLTESFVPEPAASRVPVLLPTSLRLSALA